MTTVLTSGLSVGGRVRGYDYQIKLNEESFWSKTSSFVSWFSKSLLTTPCFFKIKMWDNEEDRVSKLLCKGSGTQNLLLVRVVPVGMDRCNFDTGGSPSTSRCTNQERDLSYIKQEEF